MDQAAYIIAVANGATAALCAFSALQFIIGGIDRQVAQFGALFCASISISAMITSPGVAPQLGLLVIPLLFFTCGKMAFFWWFAQALLDDRFAWRPWHTLPFAATSLVSVLQLGGLISVETSQHIFHAITLTLLAHIVHLALRDHRSDLVNCRRWFRIGVGTLIPFVITVIILVHSIEMVFGGPLQIRYIEPVVTAIVAFVFAVWMTRIEQDVVLGTPEPKPQATSALQPADKLDLGRIEGLVSDGVCLEPGLTIGAVADRLNMPEHRLRKLINQGLGYRNFADFLNAHRIEAAQQRLADPALAREQIIQHAFALGYNSLTPFNRAFRARTGLSPTEYRNQALQTIAGE